jgi:hypothetical protein
VDAEFAREWYEWASKWDLGQTAYATPISALRLGDIALFFHPGELYSVYGLTLRRDSTFPDTIVIGYMDDLIGYVPDRGLRRKAGILSHCRSKIMSLPCFKPEVGRALTAAGLELMRKLSGNHSQLFRQRTLSVHQTAGTETERVLSLHLLGCRRNSVRFARTSARVGFDQLKWLCSRAAFSE